MKSFRILLALFCLVAFGCAKKEPVVEHAMRGEITLLDPEHKVATIKHEDIKDFMKAMTMEYTVRDEADFAKLKVGGKINAIVFVQGDDYWVGRVKSAQ